MLPPTVNVLPSPPREHSGRFARLDHDQHHPSMPSAATPHPAGTTRPACLALDTTVEDQADLAVLNIELAPSGSPPGLCRTCLAGRHAERVATATSPSLR